MGLVSRVVASAELPAAVDGVLADLRRSSPLVMRMNVRMTQDAVRQAVRGGATRGGKGVPRRADGDRGRARRPRVVLREAPSGVEEPMRILIVGAGALGGLAGAFLTRAGEDVTHARDQRGARTPAQQGRAADRADGSRRIPHGPGAGRHIGRRTRALRPGVHRGQDVPDRGRHEGGAARHARAARSSCRCRTASATRKSSPASSAPIGCSAASRTTASSMSAPDDCSSAPGIKPIQIAPLDGERDAGDRGHRRAVPPRGARYRRRREHRPRRLAEAAAQRGRQSRLGHHRTHLQRDPRRRGRAGVHARPVSPRSWR